MPFSMEIEKGQPKRIEADYGAAFLEDPQIAAHVPLKLLFETISNGSGKPLHHRVANTCLWTPYNGKHHVHLRQLPHLLRKIRCRIHVQGIFAVSHQPQESFLIRDNAAVQQPGRWNTI